MALGSNEPKKLTRQQVIDRAVELDLRRQEQIANQAKIIGRLTEINQHYESFINGLVIDTANPSWLLSDSKACLDEAAEINKKHREKKDD